MDQTLEELLELAIKNCDVPRAMELNHQIKQRDAKEKQAAEERKQLADAIKVLDMLGITGTRLDEILNDLHGDDE
ncbi:hypothetical protein ACGWYO_002517 [Enterococcus hirae]